MPVPRFLQAIALVLVFVISGAPAVLAELLEDDCAERCADEDQTGCPDEGCADCSIICSSCPRTHVVAPSGANLLPTAPLAVARITTEAGQRVPTDPPPEGVFHPPRLAG
jgi:hypothetical protein